MNPERRGAAASVAPILSAIDLATLVSCLTEAIEPVQLSRPEHAWPFLSYEPAGRILRLNTSAVLRRLVRSKDKLGQFLRDLPHPRAGLHAYIGGRLVDGSDQALLSSITKLVGVLEKELIGVCQERSLDLTSLLMPAEECLSDVSKRIGSSLDTCDAVTRLCHVRFRDPARKAKDDSETIGRLMAAIEEIEGGDRFERFARPLRRLMEHQSLPQDEIGNVIDYHRSQYQTPGSQLSRFLDFLDDNGLSRVRLAICFQIMAAVGDEATRRAKDGTSDFRLLSEYVRRARELYLMANDPQQPSIDVQLSHHFGAKADFSLGEVMAKVFFYHCLPVFCTNEAQIFEADRPSQESAIPAVAREVSYRFKVNGKDPVTQQSAFLNRLEKIRESLQDEHSYPPVPLAELIYLAVVIPGSPSTVDPLNEAKTVIERLRQGGRAAASALLDELRDRATQVDQIARALIKVLRLHGVAITSTLSRRSWQFYLCVLRGIINRERATTAVDNPLCRPDPGVHEHVPWLRNLVVTEGTPMPEAFFSVRVTVRLAERGLCLLDEPPVERRVQRRLQGRTVQVLWRPFLLDAGGSSSPRWTPLDRSVKAWAFPARIDVEYDPRTLQPKSRQDSSEQFVRLDDEQVPMFAAYRTAFTVLVYAALFVILRKVRSQETGIDDPTVLMLRLQQQGRDSEDMSAAQSVYAAAQAIEHALGRDIRLHSQGFVDSAENESTRRYRIRGTFAALLSAFPLHIQTSQLPQLGPIGVVTFATRPCDRDPEALDATHEGFVFLGRTYVARPTPHPVAGFDLDPDQHITEVDFGQDSFDKPKVVLERISRLYELGCRHIIYLAHRYGGRHIGRSALRHRHHENPIFLSQVATRFPDLVLYPLVRDVFPATRLRQRERDEDAFEVLRPAEHLDEYVRDDAADLRTGFVPFYTLATLSVVGQEEKRPQSGFATYFLLHDAQLSAMEWVARAYANLADPNSAVRDEIIAVLRGLHYIEAEKEAIRVDGRAYVRPVLDPYAYMHPDTIAGAGELIIRPPSRRRAGQTLLSLPAVLARVSSVLHAHHGIRARSQ